MNDPILRSRRALVIALVLALLIPSIAGISAPLRTSWSAFAQSSSGPVVEPNPTGEQVLRIAGPSDGLYSLDPAFSRDLASAFMIRQLFRGLTQLDDELRPEPALAKAFEVSDDGLEYRFDLRSDATFHDGRLISAEDVAASLARAVIPATAGGDITQLGGPTFLSEIAGFDEATSGTASTLSGISTPDESTVVIRLSRPSATFLMKLAAAPAMVVDRFQAAQDGEWWRSPNGSGPFRVSEWQPDDHMTLVRYDDYWGGVPSLTRIELSLGVSSLQPFNLYQSNEIDYVGISYGSVESVRSPQSPYGGHLRETPLFAVDYIAFRSDVEPFDDPNIRRALQLSFPREKSARVGLEGFVPAATGLIPDGMLGTNWTSELLPFDPTAAAAAIAASRYGSAENVPPIQIYASSFGGAEQLRDSVRSTSGLRIEVVDADWPVFMTGLANQQFSAYELYWGADYPDPESLLRTLFGTGRPDNYVGYSNPRFDDLVGRASAEQDETTRGALYLEAQQVLLDDGVVIPLYFDKAYTLVQPYVKNLVVTPLGILYLDRVWLER